MSKTRTLAAAVAAAVTGGAIAGTGPSSSASPYVTPVAPGVSVTAILTVGDSVNAKPDGSPYRMVGIPDGLGVYDKGDGSMVVLMNHELGAGAGIARAHGSAGAFVSEWTLRKSDLAVLGGRDLIQQVNLWTGSAYAASAASFARLCSADLAAPTAFYNSKTGLGTTARLFMNGEENGPTGRAFAHVATGANAGTSYEFFKLGRASWENVVPNPYEQNRTVVVGLDDTHPDSAPGKGQLSLYVGMKRDSGNEMERAGLTDGTRFYVSVAGAAGAKEGRTTGIATGTKFSLTTDAGQGTSFLRPEDGAWDAKNPSKFYFVTTDRFDSVKDGSGGTQVGRSRLYSLTFDDIANPEAGGTVKQELDGTGPTQMLDNLTVAGDGTVIIQEDPGGNPHNAKTWRYDPATGRLTMLLESDVARFGRRDGTAVTPATAPFNNDEENSGVVEVTGMLDGVGGYDTAHYRYYLGVTQAHYALGGELVEGGQLYLFAAPVPEPETYAMALAGLGVLGTVVRRRRNLPAD
ncbi:MAG TPA: PEP-CTERM sorting domain-containing protein [Rhodocyclaceae bacterium]|nr:PEP-CTERM sorting domain-containing protein [Rhodocyclaceae bacterium]